MFGTNRRSSGVMLMVMGLLVCLMGIGGSWNSVYGQSAGPPPAQQPPAGGRPAAVAGAEGEAPSAANQPQAARPQAVAGESGVGAASGEGTAQQLPNGGASSGMQWPLLLAGVLLIAGGAILFVRTRRTG